MVIQYWGKKGSVPTDEASRPADGPEITSTQIG